MGGRRARADAGADKRAEPARSDGRDPRGTVGWTGAARSAGSARRGRQASSTQPVAGRPARRGRPASSTEPVAGRPARRGRQASSTQGRFVGASLLDRRQPARIEQTHPGPVTVLLARAADSHDRSACVELPGFGRRPRHDRRDRAESDQFGGVADDMGDVADDVGGRAGRASDMSGPRAQRRGRARGRSDEPRRSPTPGSP